MKVGDTAGPLSAISTGQQECLQRSSRTESAHVNVIRHFPRQSAISEGSYMAGRL